MRKLLSRYSLITTLLVGVGVFALPHFAHAGMTDWILNWSSIGADLIYGFISKIFWFGTIPLTAWVLWLVGLMIDGIITLSSTPSFYDAPAISASWGIIRDVCNMLFIFILIYEGIRTILNIGNMTSVKSTIAGVILAAVFINFSLFATKVVIDVSNITAAWFIQGVKNVGGTESVSDAVVASLQMKKLVQNNQYGRAAMTKESFVAGMALTVLNLVAIYVLFKVFFLLLGRLITFMFLLITAPIGFVGFLLPQLKGYAEKWWRELNAMAMMAPIFFLMLYITLFIIDQVDLFVFGGAGATDPVTGSSFAPANYIMFAIIIAMLLKVLEVTEEYSGEAAGKIGDLFKSGIGVALGAATAGAGMALRQTVGSAAFNVTQDDKKMGALRAGAANSLFGKIKLAAVNKGASSSFDARATGLGAKAMSGMGAKIQVAGIGVDASKVGKTESGGFKAGTEAFAKKEKEWAEKNLGKGKAGEVNRIVYAEKMQKSLFNKITNPGVGSEAYSAAYKDIKKAAQDNFRKTGVEDAKKATKDISNKIVDEQMAIFNLESAIKSDNENEINSALENEKKRIEDMASTMEQDALKKNKAAHLEYSLIGLEERAKQEGPLGDVARSTKADFESKLAELHMKMTAEEQEKAKKEGRKISEFMAYKNEQVSNIKQALEQGDIAAKKVATKKVTETITSERIGIKKVKDEKGNVVKVNGKDKVEKSGLAKELDEKKKELKEKQDELDAIEGKKAKGADKKPAEKPKEAKKESDEDDDDDE